MNECAKIKLKQTDTHSVEKSKPLFNWNSKSNSMIDLWLIIMIDYDELD